MKIPYLKLITYGFLFVTTLASCKKENDILPVSQYLKNMIPYKNGQIVKFMGSDNQVITTKVEVQESVESCTTCQPNEKRQVIDYILRNTANVDYKTVATLEIIDRAENYIFMSLYNPIYDFASGNGFDFQTIDKTSQFFIDNDKYIFHKNITIYSKIYNDVLAIQLISPSIKEDDLSVLYYSKEKGIIKFEFKNGQSYQLVE